MANAMFDKGREGFLDGSLDWDTQLIKIVFCDHADDTPVAATDEDLADIGAAARVGTSGALGTKTVTAGVADAADTVVSAVSGDVFESVVVYYDSTVESTSRLILLIDTATGLPMTPNGGDITAAWDDGANKIFKL